MIEDLAWQRRQETIDEITHGMHLAASRFIEVRVPACICAKRGLYHYSKARGIKWERDRSNPHITAMAEPYDSYDDPMTGDRYIIQWPAD